MTTYIELVNYWKGIKTHVPAIKMVTVGRDEQALDNQSAPSLINYPHLRVDTPSISFLNDDENPVTQFKFQIFLLAAEITNLPDKENELLSTMLVTMQQVLKRIWVDADLDLFDIVQGNKEGDAIRGWSGDNCFGWTTTVTMMLYTSEC